MEGIAAKKEAGGARGEWDVGRGRRGARRGRRGTRQAGEGTSAIASALPSASAPKHPADLHRTPQRSPQHSTALPTTPHSVTARHLRPHSQPSWRAPRAARSRRRAPPPRARSGSWRAAGGLAAGTGAGWGVGVGEDGRGRGQALRAGE